jgi:hypothetical protein
MTNGEMYDDFLQKIAENPNTDENIRILASRMRNDVEFNFAYLQFTSIMLIRFPQIFTMSVLINIEKLDKKK